MRFNRILPLCFLFLGGCSVVEPLVYRIDINQGNYIEQSDVDKLRYNMTKEQVQYLFGSNMLIDQINPNQWSYIKYIKPGHGDAQEKRLFITFNKDGKIIDVKGDFKIPDLNAPVSTDE